MFKVGDVIVPKEGTYKRYTITNENNGWVGEVIEVDEFNIIAKTLSISSNIEDIQGIPSSFRVESKHFELKQPDLLEQINNESVQL